MRWALKWGARINSPGYAQTFYMEWHRLSCALHDDPFSELAETSPAKATIMRAQPYLHTKITH